MSSSAFLAPSVAKFVRATVRRSSRELIVPTVDFRIYFGPRWIYFRIYFVETAEKGSWIAHKNI